MFIFHAAVVQTTRTAYNITIVIIRENANAKRNNSAWSCRNGLNDIIGLERKNIKTKKST